VVGGLVVPVAISFSSLLSDQINLVSKNTKNTAIIVVLQNSKTSSSSRENSRRRQQQQQQQQQQQHQQQKSSTSGKHHHRHHRIVFLEEESSLSSYSKVSSSSLETSSTTIKEQVVVKQQVEPMTTSDACPYCLVEADSHRWPFEEHFYKECQPMQAWETMSFPTCNLLHQLDMMPQLVPVVTTVQEVPSSAAAAAANSSTKSTTTTTTTTTTAALSPSLLSTAGSWRTVWTVQDTATATTSTATSNIVVAKFLKFTHRNFTHEAYEKHNTDALVMEHLTASPYIVNAHAYCGQSVITEHADTDTGGIRSFIKRSDFGSRSRLRLARDMAGALAVLHYRDDIVLMARSNSAAAAADKTTATTNAASIRPLRATIAHVRRRVDSDDF
jgi:hypothetical protein